MKCNEGHEMQERTGNAEFELSDGVSVTLKDARVFRCKECGVESPVVPAPAALVRAAAETMAKSRRITLADVEGRNLPVKLRDGLARLFSPYL